MGFLELQREARVCSRVTAEEVIKTFVCSATSGLLSIYDGHLGIERGWGGVGGVDLGWGPAREQGTHISQSQPPRILGRRSATLPPRAGRTQP